MFYGNEPTSPQLFPFLPIYRAVLSSFISTAIIILANGNQRPDSPAWHLWLVAGVAGLVVWRTKIHLLWLLGAGALLGALGFV